MRSIKVRSDHLSTTHLGTALPQVRNGSNIENRTSAVSLQFLSCDVAEHAVMEKLSKSLETLTIMETDLMSECEY